jgi:signal transduction histidine kinase
MINGETQGQPTLSVTTASWRTQLSIAFALMTIIPLLTLGYFLTTYVLPYKLTEESLLTIIILNIGLSAAGFGLLYRIMASLSKFRKLVENIAHGNLDAELPVESSHEFNSITMSIGQIVKRLQNDRTRLLTFSEGLEKAVEERTIELRKATDILHDSETRYRALAAQLAQAQELERRRLAQELHDQVLQTITALGINLNVILGKQGASSNGILADRLNESLLQVEQLTEDIRNIMSELSPPVLVDYGLPAALRWFVAQYSKRNNIPVDLQCIELSYRLPVETETAVFRIAQEALTNAAKHAQPSTIRVVLDETDTNIRLVITDDGKGFDPNAAPNPQKTPGWGIQTMRARASNAGGTLAIYSQPGTGTEVRLEMRK